MRTSSGGRRQPANGCEVWYARLGDLRPRHDSLLDRVEGTRRAAYRQQADADRFTLGRALARLVVARERKMPASSVRLDSTCRRCGEPHGKPRVAGPAAPELSISHAGEWVLLAVSHAGAVGVDIDTVSAVSAGSDAARPDAAGPDAAELATQVLTGSELHHLRRLPAEEQPAGFVRYWVRKEAALKATGLGLALDPTGIEISAPDEVPVVVSSGDLDHPAETFALADVSMSEGYLAAVAVVTDPPVSVASGSGRRPLSVRLHDAAPLLRGWAGPTGDRGATAPAP
ncbi:MAG: 4'-phosphopantetheinyl transferase family protein [Actinopolymorphaceae bacterium]